MYLCAQNAGKETVMNGYVVYLAVQQTTAEFAHEARPDARVQFNTEADLSAI